MSFSSDKFGSGLTTHRVRHFSQKVKTLKPQIPTDTQKYKKCHEITYMDLDDTIHIKQTVFQQL